MATVCTSDELAFEFCTQVVSARHAARGSEDGDRALAVSTPVPLRLRFLQPDSESDDELEADRMFLASVCSTNVSVKQKCGYLYNDASGAVDKTSFFAS